MSFVVDASVAIKWFVPEPLQHQAHALLYAEGGRLEAPDLLLVEVANISWKKALRGEITEQQAIVIPQEVRDTLAVCEPSPALLDEALALALSLRHPVYDCIYLAFLQHADRTLITADERLCRAVADTSWARQIRWLGAPNAFPPAPN